MYKGCELDHSRVQEDSFMKCKTVGILGLLVFCVCLQVQASTVEDIVALSQKNVGEEVLLALIEQGKASYSINAADIIKLKDANVSEKVIVAMIRHKGTEEIAVANNPVAPTTTNGAAVKLATANSPAPQKATQREEPARNDPSPVTERVVERPQVVETPQPTVVYSDPVYTVPPAVVYPPVVYAEYPCYYRPYNYAVFGCYSRFSCGRVGFRIGF